MGVFDAAWLTATALAFTPLAFAAAGELVSQRAGVINIGLEGMMLFGAFFGFWGAYESGYAWIGLLAGAGAGVLLASVMALLSINGRADQIVVGIGIYLLGIGVTGFAYREAFEDQRQVILPRMDSVAVPGLSDVPFVGEALFDQRPYVYLAYVALPAVAFILTRTTWGLAFRSAGDYPEATTTAGLSVVRVRWWAVICAGAGAGLAGAVLSVGSVGTFLNGMTSGRGFLALAAVFFGVWRPWGVFGACLVFAAADALQLRLQSMNEVPGEVWLVVALVSLGILAPLLLHRDSWRRHQPTARILATVLLSGGAFLLFVVRPSVTLPSQLWLATPFVLTIVALAVLGRSAAQPRFLGVAYIPSTEA